MGSIDGEALVCFGGHGSFEMALCLCLFGRLFWGVYFKTIMRRYFFFSAFLSLRNWNIATKDHASEWVQKALSQRGKCLLTDMAANL